MGYADDHQWSQRHLSHYVEGDLGPRARRRLVDKNTANAAAAATAATAMATVIATTSAAASKKWPTGRSKTKNATSTSAAVLIAGRA